MAIINFGDNLSFKNVSALLCSGNAGSIALHKMLVSRPERFTSMQAEYYSFQ